MNSKYLSVSNKTNLLITDPACRPVALVSALALALSISSPMPSSQVDSQESYFNLQVKPTHTALYSEFNENLIIDIKELMEQTKMFWLIRYQAAYPLTSIMYASNNGFFDTVYNVPGYLPAELHTFLDGQYKQAIIEIAKEVLPLIVATTVI